jgi:hypothetical protein
MMLCWINTMKTPEMIMSKSRGGGAEDAAAWEEGTGRDRLVGWPKHSPPSLLLRCWCFIGSSSRVVPCPNLSQPVWQPKVSQSWCTLRLFFHNCCAALFWDCNNKFWGFLESLVIILANGLQFCYSQKTNYKFFSLAIVTTPKRKSICLCNN